MVKLDRPQGAYCGGSAAAPVTRATMEAILAAQQTPIDRWALAQVARAEEIDAPSRESNGGETALVPRFAELRLDGYSASVGAQGSSVSRWRDSAALENRTHVRVPDVLGLSARAAARRIHEAGLRAEWDGSGVTKTMVPRAGSLLAPGDTVGLAWGEGSGDD